LCLAEVALILVREQADQAGRGEYIQTHVPMTRQEVVEKALSKFLLEV